MINRFYVIVIFILVSCNFGSGSYPYAEVYEMETQYEDVIKAVEQFKKDNPDYIVPEGIGLKDGKSNRSDDYWYHIYFYNKAENKILYTWVRGFGSDKSSFAFISVNNGLQLGNWKEINHDFSVKENKAEKKMFEIEILDKIKKYL